MRARHGGLAERQAAIIRRRLPGEQRDKAALPQSIREALGQHAIEQAPATERDMGTA